MNWVPRPGLQVLLEPDCRLLLIERDDDEALPRTILRRVRWVARIVCSQSRLDVDESLVDGHPARTGRSRANGGERKSGPNDYREPKCWNFCNLVDSWSLQILQSAYAA